MYNRNFNSLIILVFFFTCNKNNSLDVSGIYENKESTKLELKEDSKFQLNIPKTSTKLYGNYRLRGDKIILKINKTDYKPYKIIVLPQIERERYQLIIKGSEHGLLRNAYYEIEQEGNIIQEGIPDEEGIVEFDYNQIGKIRISGGIGWESVEIKFSEITAKSIIVEIQRQKFNEYSKQLKFKLIDDELIGLGRSDQLKLKKKTR